MKSGAAGCLPLLTQCASKTALWSHLRPTAMQKAYQRFVDILSGQPTRRELEMALAAAAGTLGLPMFAYLLLPEQRSAPSLISNYPGTWTKHYLAHRYDRLDPVIGTAAQ